MHNETPFLYGGMSGVELGVEAFDLGQGVTLRKTYAHLMSPCLMAFSPPGPKGYHPAPWKAAKGGFGFDIHIELRVPDEPLLGNGIPARETIWWIAALFRLALFPFLTVPVISDHSFDSASNIDAEPTLEPFETKHRILVPADESRRVIKVDNLQWIRAKWLDSGRMLDSNGSFHAAIKAFDSATVQGKTSSSLLALWGGLEQLFSPSPGELRYRVASSLASYLEPPGETRLQLYKRILKLYNERSLAAHTAKDIESAPLFETYVLMRNALVKIIDENCVPTQQELEARLFGCA
jgi:hypothetical protein